MKTVKINCPECGLCIEYWTRNNFIECPKCKHVITVEPCKETEKEQEELLKNDEKTIEK